MIEIHWSPSRTTCAVVCMDEEPVRLALAALNVRDGSWLSLAPASYDVDVDVWAWEVEGWARVPSERHVERLALSVAVDVLERLERYEPLRRLLPELARLIQERNHG